MLAQILNLSRERLGTLTKVSELESTMVRAWHEGLSRRELLGRLRPLGLRIEADRFYRYSEQVYSQLERASKVADLEDDEAFLIGNLPQQNRNLPGRFWARVELTIQPPKGAAETKYRTYVFSEKMTVGELTEDIMGSYSEYYSKSRRSVTSVSILELYKQY